MKKIYLGIGLLLSSLNIFAQSQVPNPGFENWGQRLVYEYPAQWTNSNQYFNEEVGVFKSPDAQAGNFSAELRTKYDDSFSFVAHGEIGDEPSNGIPYTADVTNVKFWYKSDFTASDSIYVLVIRYLGGTMVGQHLGAAATGTHSEWTEATFEIPAGAQDHLFIAFLTASPDGGYGNTAGSWFRIDNVRMFDGSTQRPALPNFSFENWSSYSVEDPVSWYSVNQLTDLIGFSTAVKSTDAHSGTYSAELKTQYSEDYDDDLPGVLSLTDLNGNAVMEGIPYTAMPTSLSLWYKFTPSGSGDDEASVLVMFYKNDMQLDNFEVYFTEASEFTQLTVPFTLTEQPDSVNVILFSGAFDGANLKVDDIQFNGGTVGLDQFSKSHLSVFPNPATDKVMIKAEGSYSWEIVTLSGTTVLSGATSNGAQEINTSGLSAGTYIVRLNGEASSVIQKLVIQ